MADDPGAGRFSTVQALELALAEAAAIEQGMMLQNLGLMSQALGLGGFPNFAPHPFSWFQALGFRMGQMPASRYVGATRLISTALGLLGRDRPIPYPLGLERDGRLLLRAYCPPYFPDMEAAVQAVAAVKFGPQGIFRGGTSAGGWSDPAGVAAAIPALSERAVEATVAYCDYIYQRYGRFPAYSPPVRTVMGYQATHVDAEFYARFYRPEALTETQRQHMARWHMDEGA